MSRHIVTKRLQRLWQAYGRSPVVVFQAPAGCGKTRAAEWWAGSLGKPTLWLPLANEQELQQGWTFLQGLNGRVADLSGRAPIGGLLTVDACLAEVRRAFPQGVTLVCEDWHLAQGADREALLTALGAACGDGLHLIVTSRTALDLPALADWQIRQRAVLLCDDDLRLDVEDVAGFLDVPLALAQEAHAHTHGWAFALVVLAGVIHRGMAPVDWHLGEAVAAFWRHHVLGQYPPEIVTFVQATAVMDSFTPAVCEALQLPDVNGCLQRLQADHLFLHRHGDRYAYHDLARQAVMAGMGPGDRRQARLQAGRALWLRDDQGCLPLLLAAEAYDEAAKAIAFFAATVWRETTIDAPLLRHWVGLLPADRLLDNPWYMLLYAWLAMTSAPPASLLATLDRAAAACVRSGEVDGETLALISLARWHNALGDIARWHRTGQRLARLANAGEVSPPLRLPVISALVRYYGVAACDPDRMEHWLMQAQQHLPTTPVATALSFEIHLSAATAYGDFGERTPGWENWRRALDLQPRLPGYDTLLTGIDAHLRMLGDDPVPSPPATATSWADDMVRHRAFEIAEDAWQRQDSAHAEALYEQVVAPGGATNALIYNSALQLSWVRLSLARCRRHDISGAMAAIREGAGCAGTPYTACLLTWHEAFILASAGRLADASQALTAVLAEAETRHFTFIWVLAGLLQAHLQGLGPPVTVLQVIDLWDYGPALARYYPELPIDTGGQPARVAVRSLGGLRVTVDGIPVQWKRTNAQLLLVDLLLHPAGSSRDDLLRRYWPNGDSATLHKDINVLRQTLEPDRPGRESRYVTHEQGIYRLTADPTLIWWDVPALRSLHRHGRRASRIPSKRRAFADLMAEYQGPFVPEFAAYAPVAACQKALQALRAAAVLPVFGG